MLKEDISAIRRSFSLLSGGVLSVFHEANLYLYAFTIMEDTVAQTLFPPAPRSPARTVAYLASRTSTEGISIVSRWAEALTKRTQYGQLAFTFNFTSKRLRRRSS